MVTTMDTQQQKPQDALSDTLLGVIAASAVAVFVMLATSPVANAAANFNQLAEHYGKLAGKPPASFSAERGNCSQEGCASPVSRT